MILRELIYRRRYPKFAKRRKRLVWRAPKPIYMASDDGVAYSYAFPTVSPRRLRYLGRREVYPHAHHVHLSCLLHTEEPG